MERVRVRRERGREADKNCLPREAVAEAESGAVWLAESGSEGGWLRVVFMWLRLRVELRES